MRDKLVFVVYILILSIIIISPFSKSDYQEINTATINNEYSGYKSVQIRFETVGSIDKYNIYYSQEKFNNSENADLHSRIFVTNNIYEYDKIQADSALDRCWYSTDSTFDEITWMSAYRDNNGFPVVPSNSTNVIYDLFGLRTNITYWFAVVAINGEEISFFEVENALSASTEIEDELPPPLNKKPVYYAILCILIFVVSLFFILSRYEKKQFDKQGYLYSLPAFLLLCVITFYPILSGFYVSFTDSNASKLGDEDFVGFDNYFEVFRESGFLRVTLTTLLWTVVNVSAHVSIGLCLAILLNREIYGKKIYRTILLLPWAIPSFISVLVWRGMFQPAGLVNEILGIESYDYFSSTSSALTMVILVNIWLGFPFMMMVFSGALQTIPKDLYEAADIDGVSDYRQFWNITIPLLKPTIIPVSLLGFIWTFNMFNVIYLMTAGGPVVEIGGPGGTDILITYVYDLAFPGGYYGLAAAWSVIIFFMLFIFSFYYTKISNATEAAQ